MSLSLFYRMIRTQDIEDHNTIVRNMAIIVEHYPATSKYAEGYAVECFTCNGEMIAALSVPATTLCQTTNNDVMHVRQLTPASS